MKKIFSSLLVLCLGTSVFGQTNTFPTTGNVGIGTTSPNYKTEIRSGTLGLSGGSEAFFEFHSLYSGVDLKKWRMAIGGGASAFNLTTRYDNGAKKGDILYITNSGNVGVGTTSPNAKLEINGNFLRLQEPVAGRTLDIHPSTSGQTHRFTSTTTVAGYSFENNAGALMTIAASGKIGVGTTSPGAALDVGAGFTPRGGNTDILIGSTSPQIEFYDTNESGAIIYEDNGLALYTNGSPWVRNLFLKNDGNVGIGTSLPTEKLSVDGTVLAKKVRVSAAGVDWPDYVFTSDYELRTLNQVEDFIKANKHLPEVPSAKQVEVNGLDLGNMDATLLKKVEELTLYMIQLNKKVERLEKENQDLKKRIEN